jgi:hypothetical protein
MLLIILYFIYQFLILLGHIFTLLLRSFFKILSDKTLIKKVKFKKDNNTLN